MRWLILPVMCALVALVTVSPATAAPKHHAAGIAGPSCDITLGPPRDSYSTNGTLNLTASGLTPDTWYEVVWYWPNPDGWAAGSAQLTDATGTLSDWYFAVPGGATRVDVVDETSSAVVVECFGPVL